MPGPNPLPQARLPILLAPGFMTDDALWTELAPLLERYGPVGFIDLTRDDSLIGLARSALSKAPPQFVLIGFSMGGYVAREMVREAPDRVRALVLVATSARGDSEIQQRRKLVAASRLGATHFSGLSRVAIATSLHPSRAGDAALIDRIHAMGDRLGAEVFVRQSALRRDGDVATLGQIRCPTLVIAADADRLRSLDEARELANGIPGARFRLIEGSGHMLPLEAPKALAEVIGSWLDEVEGGAEAAGASGQPGSAR